MGDESNLVHPQTNHDIMEVNTNPQEEAPPYVHCPNLTRHIMMLRRTPGAAARSEHSRFLLTVPLPGDNDQVLQVHQPPQILVLHVHHLQLFNVPTDFDGLHLTAFWKVERT